MTQANASIPELSPEDAERFAALFRPSWEAETSSPALASVSSVPADPLTTKALAQTMPLGAAAPMSDAPKTVESAPDGASKRQKTLVMAGAPGRSDASAPLPSFDLPLSAPKLPPAPVSESDVAKTSVYKQVNAADVVLPDDDVIAPKKSNKNLIIGVGIAAALGLVAAIGFGTSSSGDAPKAEPSANLSPPKPPADIPPPPPAAEAPASTAIPGMNEPKAAKPAEAAKPAAEPTKPAEAAKPAAPKPEAQKPAAAAAKPAPAAPPAPAPAKPAGKPGGGIVRDAPF